MNKRMLPISARIIKTFINNRSSIVNYILNYIYIVIQLLPFCCWLWLSNSIGHASTVDTNIYPLIEQCCHNGTAYAQHSHSIMNKLPNGQHDYCKKSWSETDYYSSYSSGLPYSTLCEQMKQHCCRQHAKHLRCEYGKQVALQPIFGNYDNSNGQSSLTERSCEQHFLSSGHSQYDKYSCCKECQMGVLLAIQYSNSYSSPHEQNVCQRFAKLISDQTIQHDSVFEDCCRQMADWFDFKVGKKVNNKPSYEDRLFNQATIQPNTQPQHQSPPPSTHLNKEIENIKSNFEKSSDVDWAELMDYMKKAAEGDGSGLPIRTISQLDDINVIHHNSSTLTNQQDPIANILDLDDSSKKIDDDTSTKIIDLDFTDNPLLDNDFPIDISEYGLASQCSIGFQWDSLDGICKDINECQIGTHNCHEALRCDNTIGSFLCVRVQDCGTGYTINADTYECDDIDECALNIHHCGQDYRCRNTQGSFKCDRIRCPAGQVLVNGFCRRTTCQQSDWVFDYQTGLCQPRQDPCASDPCRPEERCLLRNEVETSISQDGNSTMKESLSSNWSYYCVPRCHYGYRFNFTLMKCTDIDECKERTHRCSFNQQCVNTEGYYRCECLPGFEYDARSRKCIDKNECLERDVMLECSRQSKTCINTVGSYRCECAVGSYWNDAQAKCIDLNECLPEWNRCEHLCINTIGSYYCQCHSGYRLMVNRHNCTDIDECRVGNSSRNYKQSMMMMPFTTTESMTTIQSLSSIEQQSSFEQNEFVAPCRGICKNEIGSYHCQCPKGFRLSPHDSHRCVDINECNEWDICQTIDNPFQKRKHCINLYGSFECANVHCPDGYTFHRTDQSLQCRWKDLNSSNRRYNGIPEDYYHQYDYLYYSIYKNQTKFLQNGVSSMYLYTIRLDKIDSIHDQRRQHFQLRLLSSEWLPVIVDHEPNNYNRRSSSQLSNVIEKTIIYPAPSTKDDQRHLAEQRHFQLKLNRAGNEANVNIVWPLDGPQKIQLELIASGFRHGQYIRQRSILTLFVSQYDRF